MAQSTLVQITAADGHEFDATLWEPSDMPPSAVVMCSPAMGVPGRFYDRFAQSLAIEGIAAATFDLRGIGSSSLRADRKTDFGYYELVEFDYPALVTTLRHRLPDRPLFLMGHSLGGQVNCLYASVNAEVPSGLILIACSSVYWRKWSFPKSLGVLVLQQTAIALSRLFGYFPGRALGFGGREARRTIRDWARQGRTGEYRVEGSSYDFEASLSFLHLPVYALSFTDDGLAARAATEHLISKMPKSKATKEHISPRDLDVQKVGHFGWAKLGPILAPRIARWVRSVSEPSA